MENIQQCMTPVIHDCLRRFLLDSWNEGEREYMNPLEQVQEVLFHANYFSLKDIDACLTFDLDEIQDGKKREGARILFEVIVQESQENEY